MHRLSWWSAEAFAMKLFIERRFEISIDIHQREKHFHGVWRYLTVSVGASAFKFWAHNVLRIAIRRLCTLDDHIMAYIDNIQWATKRAIESELLKLFRQLSGHYLDSRTAKGVARLLKMFEVDVNIRLSWKENFVAWLQACGLAIANLATRKREGRFWIRSW